MYIEGVPSAPFDAAGHDVIGVMNTWFSPDGKRCAYLARRGNDLLAIVDGKETRIGSPGSTFTDSITYLPELISPIGPHPHSFFYFNPDSAHVAFLSLTIDHLFHLVVDGAPGPGYQMIDPNQVSWGGSHVAYAAQTRDGKSHAVIDNRVGPPFDAVRWLSMTPDGAHYAYAANQTLMVDGTARGPIEAGDAKMPYVLSPDGRVALAKRAGSGLVTVLNGTELPDTLLSSVRFRPDGKGVAYIKSTEAGGKVVVADGRPGAEYQQISDLQYSRSGRLAYIAKKGGLDFAVVDGVEGPGRTRVDHFRFSDDGKRFSYVTFTPAGPDTGFSVVVDGVASPLFRAIEDPSFTFSPDGSHYAFVGDKGYLQFQLVRDGQATNLTGFGRFAARAPKVAMPFPRLAFSADGAHLAFFGTIQGRNRGGLVLDGEPWPGGSWWEFPSFSPDGRHFAAAEWVQGHITAWVDGHPGPVYDDIPEISMGAFGFIDNTTLRFIAAKQDSIYRVLVKPRQ